MVDPLGLIAYIFNDIGVDIPETQVKEYWNHYRAADINAEWATWSDASDCHIPLGLYGDACKIRPGEKMIGLFLNLPLWRPRSIRVSSFLLTCVQEELLVGRTTLDCLWRHIVWACNVLHDGRWPHTGPNGEPMPIHQQPLAGQFIVPNRYFSVTEIRGGWVWFKQIFAFRSSWKGGARLPVCFQCEARSSGQFLYYDVGEDSPVWSTEYKDLAEFLVKQMPANPSCSACMY